MLGYIPEEDLPAIYQACDLFVLVALCETQSLPALQALVTGLPLILAEAGCLPELVEEGVNGYLVPPNDYHAISQAALRILNSPQQPDEISNASLAIGLPHSEQYSVSALIDLYDRMISGDQP
jgi:glycosyltransferase involved in cell wall biosynthesis